MCNIIHIYDIRQATADHLVVPIYYEPRLAKLHIDNEQLESQADKIIEDL